MVHVGQGERWEVLLAGAPLEQVSSAEHEATLGTVVVSPELWRVIEQCVPFLSQMCAVVVSARIQCRVFACTNRYHAV